MRFAFTDEQERLRAEARRFLADRVDVRAQIELPGAHAVELWKELAAQGWLGVAVPERYGGMGLGWVEAAIVFAEAGRALLPGPFAPTVLGGVLPVLLAGSEEQKRRLLPRIVAGEIVAAIADAPTIRGETVEGDAAAVPGATVADLLVVVPDDRRPLVVTRDAFTAEPVETADLTRPCARVTFDGAGERLAVPLPERYEHAARVMIAAEMTGAAEACLAMAVAYANERVQFGRPIGSFQAIKHKAADMMRALEAARLASAYASWALDANTDDAAVASSIAKASADDAFMRCASENIQIHGGIGVTWEHDAHLYYRRALATRVLFGSAVEHQDRVAQALLDGGAFRERA